MMNTTQAFLLLMWAIIGLLLVVFSPTRRFRAQVGGLSNEEVTLVLRQKDEQGIPYGCRCLPGWLLELVQTVVVEPIYLLWSLLSHVGQREIAYGALAALLVNVVLVSIITHIVRKVRGGGLYPKITWVTWICIFIASLPTLYLWYLFFVVIGIIR